MLIIGLGLTSDLPDIGVNSCLFLSDILRADNSIDRSLVKWDSLRNP